jgi:endo-1,4-beta-D-glucanase Y
MRPRASWGLGLALVCASAATAAGPSSRPARVDLLRETWRAYLSRFVQADGRVVDPKAGGITTSEGQAYALLRAVWMDDRPDFDRVLEWARRNLNTGVRKDHLWAWKWGAAKDGKAGVLDRAFASDADQDAALALILAWKQWGERGYLLHARRMLADLWQEGTIVSGGRRLLLGGDTLCRAGVCRLNPSYCAPYAYRIFARHDPERRWLTLVDGCYSLLDADVDLTTTHLPTDWLLLDVDSGRLRRGTGSDSRYSYDALRVAWRVELDARLFDEPRARRFQERSLGWLASEWRKKGKLPAVIAADGAAGAEYEALEMLAAAMAAMRGPAPDVAEAMRSRVDAALAEGHWGDRDSYYTQNWAWFGTALDEGHLTPFEAVVK